MPREENLLILKMLQEGTITAEQAAELLQALDGAPARPAPSPPPTPATPAAPVPPATQEAPTKGAVLPPVESLDSADEDDGVNLGDSGDLFARARAKIAAAREAVTGTPEAPESEKAAGEQPSPPTDKTSTVRTWDSLTDALKDIPGAKSLADALRGVDSSPAVTNARRTAKKVVRSVRSQLEELNLPISSETRGDPVLTVSREATTAVPEGGTLRIRNPLGGIEALGADVPEARVAGTLRVWAGTTATAESLAEQVTLTVEQGADGPVIAAAAAPELRSVIFDLKVFVPRGITVSLLSPAGKLIVRDLRGGVALASKSGDMDIREVAGDVAAETASGDILMENVIGNVTATTASGAVTLQHGSGENLRAATQSGNLTIKELTTTTVDVESVSGNVSVNATSGRQIRVHTVSGDIEVSDVAADQEARIDTISGALDVSLRSPLNAGNVTLGTISGDAELHLPAAAQGTLSLSTRSGDIQGHWRSGEKERLLQTSGMESFAETIGSGEGARISISTTSGDIKVTQEGLPA